MHEFDLANLIQTKAIFSDATAVMDKIGGWIEEGGNDGSGKRRKSDRWKTGGVHLDLFKNSHMQLTRACGSLQGSEKEFHYGSRQLGLRRFAGQQMTRFVSSP